MTLIMSHKARVFGFTPPGNSDELLLNFKKDSTVDFPGIQSYDVPCTWSVTGDDLKIAIDMRQLEKYVFAKFDYLRAKSALTHDKSLLTLYQTKCDSALAGRDVTDIKKAANVYAGVYKFLLLRKGQILTLTSPTTDFYLMNQDSLRGGRIRILDSGQ